MKKKTLSLAELAELNKAFDKRIADARAEVEGNRAEIARFEAAMEKATEQGDIPKYKALYTKRADLELNIVAVEAIVDRAVADHNCGFSDDDVRAAWAEYVDGFNAKSAAFTREFKQMQRALVDKYISMARVQNEALNMRDNFAKYLTTNAKNTSGAPINFAPVNAIPDTYEALRLDKDSIDGVDERTWNMTRHVCNGLDACASF